jgi:hypothetical protein
MTIDPMRCRDWLPVLPLPADIVGTVDGVAITRAAFQLHYERTSASTFADLKIECPPVCERQNRRAAMVATTGDELLRQRAQMLEEEYDAGELVLLEARADRGVEIVAGSATARLHWRNARIAELRSTAILRAEGWRPPTDDQLADGLRWMAAESFLSGEVVVVAEIVTWDLDEANRLRALAGTPGVDFGELARTHSCGETALAGGGLGVFPVRSSEGRRVRGLATGELCEPYRILDRAPMAPRRWRILQCVGRWPAAAASASAVAVACSRASVQQSILREERVALLRRLRKAATIIDRVEETMQTLEMVVELPEVIAEVAGRPITRAQLVAEFTPEIVAATQGADRILWEIEHRIAREVALQRISTRTRLLQHAIDRGTIGADEAERLREPPAEVASEARARQQWSDELERSLWGRLQASVEATDLRSPSDEDAFECLLATLRDRYPARYQTDGRMIDEWERDLPWDDNGDALREVGEIDARRRGDDLDD